MPPISIYFLLFCGLCLPFFTLFALLFTTSQLLLFRNESRRDALLRDLGLEDDEASKKFIVGLFHPYCNAGGGGERVLWTAIAHMQKTLPQVVCVVYTGDKGVTKQDIVKNVESKFNIKLDPRSLQFVFLSSRWLVEGSTWPVLTLLGQSIGSMVLAWDALTHLIPDLFIDTMGYAFTFPVIRICVPGLKVGAYVHYPTISTTMLSRVKTRASHYANSGAISRSPILSAAKLQYYKLFHHLYAASLRKASFLMVNSSWTRGHIVSILKHRNWLLSMNLYFAGLIFAPRDGHSWRRKADDVKTVYPPCDTASMESFDIKDGSRDRVILSLAQFRPEKAHSVQLRALRCLFDAHPEYATGSEKITQVFIGGSRDSADEKRVEQLKELAKELQLENNVKFITNAPYSEVLYWLNRASVGISTMVDEHFGIYVVEYMAAGLIPLVHSSGGPMLDIVVPSITGEKDERSQSHATGFRASTPESYANCLHQIFGVMSSTEQIEMRIRTRERALTTFNEEVFVAGWDEVVKPWIEGNSKQKRE